MKILELASSRKLLTAEEPVTGLTSPASSRDPRGSCGEVCMVQPNPHSIHEQNKWCQKSHEALRF